MPISLVSTRIGAKIEINVENWSQKTRLLRYMCENGWNNIPFPTHPAITVWEKFFDSPDIMRAELAELKAKLPEI